MPRAFWRSLGGVLFLMSEVPLYVRLKLYLWFGISGQTVKERDKVTEEETEGGRKRGKEGSGIGFGVED